MEDDSEVFRALADPSRRRLLDLLFVRDGRTLTELEAELPMTRFGVMKHLRVLERAGLVVTRRSGREKLHFLNRVPIQHLYDRWIDKFAAPRTQTLADLKAVLEGGNTVTSEATARPQQVYEVFIKATPERVWEAISNPDLTRLYYMGTNVNSNFGKGDSISLSLPDGTVMVQGEVLESDPPRRLVQTWACTYDPEVRADPASRVTWELSAEGDGVTRVVVIHDGFDSVTKTFRDSSAGWPRVLSGLKTLLETGQPLGV